MSLQKGPRKWSQEDLEMLHAMVEDYQRARWLKGQLKWWAIWLLGLPTALVTLFKALEELWRRFHQ